MSEWGFTCQPQTEPSLDLSLGFSECFQEMFQEAVNIPDLCTDFPSYVPEESNFTELLLPKPDLCDLSNNQYASQTAEQIHHQQQQQHYLLQQPQQLNWDSYSASSSTTSPVQFELTPHDGMHYPPAEPMHFINTTFVNGRKRRAAPEPCNFQADFDFDSMEQIGGKPKRKRVQNARQRKAANVRERKRMFHLNEAFDSLKTRVPTFAYEKRLSRIETLKLAMTYISFMTQVLDGKKPDDISLKAHGFNSFTLDDLEHFKTSVSSYTSDGTDSSDSGTSSS